MNNDQSPRLTFFLMALASVFIIIFGIKLSAPILNPIVMAMVITITVLPLPDKFRQRGLPVALSMGLTILVVVGVLALVILLVFGSISQLATELPSYLEAIMARQSNLTLWLQNNNIFPSIEGIDGSFIIQIAGTILNGAASLLVATLLTLMIFFFMMSAAISFSNRSSNQITTNHPALTYISNLTGEVRRYVTITTTVNAIVGLGDVVLLAILGVDYAILWGILAWILGYIPSIGFWLAVIPPFILGWAESGLQTAVFVFIGFVLINGSVENILKPKMMGEGLNISPVIVVVSLFVWGWLLGAVGALLAIPLTLLVLSILESFESTRWLILLLRPPAAVEEEERGKAQKRLSRVWTRMKQVTKFEVDVDNS
jgi:AI-2 transport protein TqsA